MERGQSERGSVTPLVIGMMLCLLLLGVGVVAGTSVLTGAQKLQHVCDGAAAAAAGAVDESVYTRRGAAAGIVIGPAAQQRAIEYLRIRRSDVEVSLSFTDGRVVATCHAQVQVSFGALFGSPTIGRTVTANARPVGLDPR